MRECMCVFIYLIVYVFLSVFVWVFYRDYLLPFFCMKIKIYIEKNINTRSFYKNDNKNNEIEWNKWIKRKNSVHEYKRKRERTI